MKRNNLVLMVVTIAIFVVLLIGATYAYFASNTNVGNGLDFSATLDDNNIAFTATSGSLSLHVAAENMLQSQTGSGDVIAAQQTGDNNINITLSSNTEAPIACTYNIYFQWNNGQSYLTPTNASKNEFTLQLELQDSDGTGSQGTNKFASETQLTRVITNTNKTIVVEGASIVGSSVDSGSQTWVPTAKFYNLTDNQSALAGATFGGKFTIEDVECDAVASNSGGTLENSLSNAVLSKVSNGEYTSSQDNTKYVVRHEEVEYQGTTYDAGVRFEGKNPDNYVRFNGNEEWRIIGVFEGSTIGLEPGKQYTKIINGVPIMYYEAWDHQFINDEPTGENDWTNSTLNTYLNGEYLQSLTDESKIAKYNGNYNTWHLRGSYADDIYVTDWYLAERITGTSGLEGSAVASTTGAIGLMYPSDYGYAAYGDSCNKASTELNNYFAGRCTPVDWLATEYDQWSISPAPASNNAAFCISGGDGWNGEVVTNDVYLGIAVRPVLYLEASVEVDSGTGTKLDPYVLK